MSIDIDLDDPSTLERLIEQRPRATARFMEDIAYTLPPDAMMMHALEQEERQEWDRKNDGEKYDGMG